MVRFFRQMITRQQVSEGLDNAESAYERCWGYLCDIKSRKVSNNNIDCIIEFQPTLAKALFDLGKLYRNISQNKKQLIDRKKHLTHRWFVSRMAALAKYQEAIIRTIAIGRGLGDAYAWFFYQKNRHYLTEHLKQEEIFHTPPGIGGVGELEFVKNVKLLHGYFVLYHGITNILRLGDITLIDLHKFTVAGVGEIKTAQVNNETIQISLLFSGPGVNDQKIRHSFSVDKPNESKQSFIEDFPDKAKKRFERQVKKIVGSYKKLSSVPSNKFGVETNSCLDALEDAFANSKCGKFNFKVASCGLAIGVYQEQRKRLSSKLRTEKGVRAL